MTDDDDADLHPILNELEPGEIVQQVVRATSTRILVTDRRIAVAQEDHVALNIEIRQLRRIQFDIERDRPATLVLVPEHPSHEPQVLAIPPETYDAVGEALAYVGRRLYGWQPREASTSAERG
jgi:hypothetical protein